MCRFLLLLSLLFYFTAGAQKLDQTVRGYVLDKVTSQPLIGANIILSDSREENIDYLQSNLYRTYYKLNENQISIGKNLVKYVWDMNEDIPSEINVDIIICFGTLYHLNNPEKALLNLSNICKEFCFISTATNGRDEENGIDFIHENSLVFTSEFS